MTNLDQIKEAVPDAAGNENVIILAGELDKVQQLESMVKTPTGQELVNALRNDCSTMIQQIISEVKDPLVFRLEAHLNLLTTLVSAEKRADELQEALDAEIKAIIS
jgi:hypothetical protein